MFRRNSNESSSKQKPLALNDSESFILDRYRLLFAKIDLISKRDGKQVIAITSAIKGEGKTTTTSNLGVVSARDFGKRCLIIDGDYKHPSLARSFGIKDTIGLINVISKESDFSSAAREGPVKNLSLLTMGHHSNRDASERGFKENSHIWATGGITSILEEVRGCFDYIFIDAPPILPLFDMSVISEAVDGVVLVVKTGETPETVLTQAVKILGSKKIIGSVLNRAKTGWRYGFDRHRYEYDNHND